jgi:acetyl-CoA carboxylase biotin carboxyl carrier protein
MWQDKLKEIIDILENSNVNEIEINFWGRKYRVTKTASVTSTLPDTSIPANKEIVELKQQKDSSEKVKDDQKLVSEDTEELLSPMPGTFYIAPTPDDSPFVSKGDNVKKGQTLCIIEAMKIMNEIEAEFDGTIIEINVENGDPVEYNQSLFLIEPA